MAIRILQGDCREVLRSLPERSVHCCVTSPPYWGLRDYGVEGQLGLEATPDEYVTKMVEVFREVRRVLRDDGTLWLNLGDSYANDGKWGGSTGGKHVDALHGNSGVGRQKRDTGLKAKDLIGIPWMVAFALRADGWYLRSDVIWAKRNCMPENVTDRPSTANEHIFLLTRQPRYFYDSEAIREEGAVPAGTRAAKGSNVRSELKDVNGRPPEYWEYTGSRNSRSVWTFATQPFPEAHFATFPPELPERCILAGTSEKGCCASCGTPWQRVLSKSRTRDGKPLTGSFNTGDGHKIGATGVGHWRDVTKVETVSWESNCDCGSLGARVVPCTVLDPFGGAGTTGLVADRLQRDAILIDLNTEYLTMATRRIQEDAGMFAKISA